MKSTRGQPRRLTDAKVEVILEWHDTVRAWQAWRAKVLSLAALARSLNVSPMTVIAVLARGRDYREPLNRQRGRPPMKMPQAKLDAIHAWFAEVRELEKAREQIKSTRQIAAEVGAPVKTIWSVIRRKAPYKQVSPDKRAVVQAERRRRLDHLRGLHLYQD